MENIFINNKIWKQFSDEELGKYLNDVFVHYRNKGFPYYQTNPEFRDKEFNKLIKYDGEILSNGIIKQTMHGLSLAWSYFPHSFDVKCNDLLSPTEVFYNDDMLRKAIMKRVKHGTYMSDSGMRKIMKIITGAQAVSNFRPTAACAIYEEFSNGGVVWDMSGGWGGRLLGAIKAKIKRYIATEPSTLTYEGLLKLANDYAGDMEYNIHCMGSEEFIPDKESLDLCFTSPPYFNLEKYSDEDTQSYVKYSSKSDWVNGFLKDTIRNCHVGLKDGCYMLINIADPKKKNNLSLESETIRIAKEIGFTYEGELKLALSNPNMKNKSGFKYEPIFIFRK